MKLFCYLRCYTIPSVVAGHTYFASWRWYIVAPDEFAAREIGDHKDGYDIGAPDMHRWFPMVVEMPGAKLPGERQWHFHWVVKAMAVAAVLSGIHAWPLGLLASAATVVLAYMLHYGMAIPQWSYCVYKDGADDKFEYHRRPHGADY